MILQTYIIDDDEIFRFILETNLKSQNLVSQIRSFENGEQALQPLIDAIKSNTYPAVVFLDINMPVMDGWLFIEELEKHFQSLPRGMKIYMLSSSIDERDSGRAQHHNLITDYLVKPMQKGKLARLFRDTASVNY